MNEARVNPASLEDGTAPRTPGELLARLRELGISHRTVRHPPVYTVEQAKALRGDLPGGHSKNLFLRDKRGRMWLVTCDEDRRLRLDALAAALGAKRLSFGSAERLMRHLGVLPGAVTPFAVINDRPRKVRLGLDAALLGHDVLNFHPLDNAMTTAIAPADLLRFLEAEYHLPDIVDLGAL